MRASLRSFVQKAWTFDSSADDEVAASAIERVVPTGCMHLVVRLSDAPLTLFTDEGGNGARSFGRTLVGGARSSSYLRSVSAPSRSIGVQLAPGAAPLLFGLPASALAEDHVELAHLGPSAEAELRERIAESTTLEAGLAALEAWLDRRLRDAGEIHPVVAYAVRRFDEGARVGDVVERSGYSHRVFLALFRDATGLAPKSYARVARVQRALAALATASSLADVALASGYADQAHLSRDLLEIAGLTPTAYRAARPRSSNHIPVGKISSRQGRARELKIRG